MPDNPVTSQEINDFEKFFGSGFSSFADTDRTEILADGDGAVPRTKNLFKKAAAQPKLADYTKVKISHYGRLHDCKDKSLWQIIR